MVSGELCELIVNSEWCEVIVDEQCVWNGDCVGLRSLSGGFFLSDIAGYAVVDAG